MSGEMVFGSAKADGATIITIPAGRQWTGSLSLSASLNALLAGGTANPIITIQSAGVSQPASGTVLAALSLSVPVVLTVTGSIAASTTVPAVTVNALQGAATLMLTFQGSTAAIATASGVTP